MKSSNIDSALAAACMADVIDSYRRAPCDPHLWFFQRTCLATPATAWFFPRRFPPDRSERSTMVWVPAAPRRSGDIEYGESGGSLLRRHPVDFALADERFANSGRRSWRRRLNRRSVLPIPKRPIEWPPRPAVAGGRARARETRATGKRRGERQRQKSLSCPHFVSENMIFEMASVRYSAGTWRMLPPLLRPCSARNVRVAATWAPA